MEIVTPLGGDVLLFHGMSAREEMSRLFEYQLDLLSAKDDVNLDDILGKHVTIKFALLCPSRPGHRGTQRLRFRAPGRTSSRQRGPRCFQLALVAMALLAG